MSASLLVRTACGGRAVAQRLRTVLWPITQTSVVAGLAWYLTHDVFNHPQAFFAPISAVVCMSATNVLRARRAQQMIVGVALGIVLGAGVHALLGSGPIAMGVVVFIALSVAVLCARGLVAQGLMFINQAAVSAVLVLVFASNGSVVFERLFDALVGGGLAIVSSILLFPPDPVVMLCSARADVLAAVRDILAELVNTVSDPTSAPPDWPMAAADRLHQQLNGLIEVRANAAMVARRAPRRWGVRSTVRDLDQQAVYLALLVSSVLHLARTIAGPGGDKLPTPVHAVLTDLAAGTGLARRGSDGSERARGRRPRNRVDTAIGCLWQQRSGARRYRPSVCHRSTTGNRTPGPVGHVSLNWRETPAPAASAPASARPR